MKIDEYIETNIKKYGAGNFLDMLNCHGKHYRINGYINPDLYEDIYKSVIETVQETVKEEA